MLSDHFLRIGGITIAVHSADPSLTWTWDDPTRRFLVPPETPEVELFIHSTPPPEPDGAKLFDSGAVWRLFGSDGGYRVECRSAVLGDMPYRVACFNHSFTRGDIYITPEAAAMQVNPLEYPLDEVLVANLLGRGRGVELHSCGIVNHEGQGLLFVGVSGAGKSTMASLWGDDKAGVVSDDRVIVREEEGAMWMYGTPWHGEAQFSMASRVPLKRIFLLAQAEENAIQLLSQAEIVARLFRCTFPLFYDDGGLTFALAFLDRLATLVPVREIRFTKDPAVVALLQTAD